MGEGIRSYWKNLHVAINTLAEGLKLSIRHLVDARFRRYPLGADDRQYFEQDKGIFTIRYPNETMPVPDHGRYKLHNEIEDCIVCDKCAKICPVDCIIIDPIKSVGSYGTTSDGTVKRLYAAKFDIDMAKCCFCGLCTTVCPTECLTMTPEFDFSEFNVENHTLHFSNMSEEMIAAKRKEWEDFDKAKTKEAADQDARKDQLGDRPKGAKFIPKMKPKTGSQDAGGALSSPKPTQEKPKPVMKSKPVMKPRDETDKKVTGAAESPKKYVPKMKPVMRKNRDNDSEKEKG